MAEFESQAFDPALVQPAVAEQHDSFKLRRLIAGGSIALGAFGGLIAEADSAAAAGSILGAGSAPVRACTTNPNADPSTFSLSFKQQGEQGVQLTAVATAGDGQNSSLPWTFTPGEGGIPAADNVPFSHTFTRAPNGEALSRTGASTVIIFTEQIGNVKGVIVEELEANLPNCTSGSGTKPTPKPTLKPTVAPTHSAKPTETPTHTTKPVTPPTHTATPTHTVTPTPSPESVAPVVVPSTPESPTPSVVVSSDAPESSTALTASAPASSELSGAPSSPVSSEVAVAAGDNDTGSGGSNSAEWLWAIPGAAVLGAGGIGLRALLRHRGATPPVHRHA